MTNLPKPEGTISAPGRAGDGGVTRKRFSLLVGLMWDLHRLERRSVLYLEPHGEPVLSVRVGPGGRAVAVLGVQDGRGEWSFIWGQGRRAAADGSMVAAQQIAGGHR